MTESMAEKLFGEEHNRERVELAKMLREVESVNGPRNAASAIYRALDACPNISDDTRAIKASVDDTLALAYLDEDHNSSESKAALAKRLHGIAQLSAMTLQAMADSRLIDD